MDCVGRLYSESDGSLIISKKVHNINWVRTASLYLGNLFGM